MEAVYNLASGYRVIDTSTAVQVNFRMPADTGSGGEYLACDGPNDSRNGGSASGGAR